jgi:putative endonuclease
LPSDFRGPDRHGILGAMSDASRPWLLYLLECRNGSWYAGITNDLDRRFQAHLRGTGARYTRANPPLRVLASRAYPDRASASRAEWQLKQLPRAHKLAWLLDQAPASIALT